MADKSNGKNTGKIVEIKGVVLDAVFPDRLPEIFHALRIEVPEDGGAAGLRVEEGAERRLDVPRPRRPAAEGSCGDVGLGHARKLRKPRRFDRGARTPLG